MKGKLRMLFWGLGWVLFFIFLISSFVMNKYTANNRFSNFSPIAWDDHAAVLKGSLSCALTSEELIDRKKELQDTIFPKVKKQEELTDGFVFYFDDEEGLAEQLMEFIAKEKQCCPFLKFDLSILPFGKGMGLRISGSEAVKEFIVANDILLKKQENR